ncbi:hypothetical protein HPB52_013403 [Rhipicephalus sanguineus]|uniref:Uncharacterized protein n=1 Tax=Rhipicephalus sanguineus TaxID=34632 RepID=A0A9D4PYT8_RHISA|nr:hypothetical protein HPB52_013403 [Rhipicephalus sanguineus]
MPPRCGFVRFCHVLRAASSSTTTANGRRLKSSASPAALDRTAESSSAELPPQRDPLDLSFNDARAAYKSKTTGELIRAFVVLKLSSSNWIVNNHQEVKCSFFGLLCCHLSLFEVLCYCCPRFLSERGLFQDHEVAFLV